MDLGRTRAFVDECFQRQYGAGEVAGFGHYLTLQASNKDRAALGYRRPGTDALFIESYLDVPVEDAVSCALGRTIQRHKIVEIGNLAADNAWSMLDLWGQAANDLAGASEIAVATLTASLRRMFGRIGLELHRLAPADPMRLLGEAADWGTYYLTDPWVCAAPISAGQEAIAVFNDGRRRRAA